LRKARVEYEVVRASAWEPDSAMGELLKVNPLGQIPTLVLADGTVLTESAAILIELGLRHPEARLLPEGAGGRGLAIRGLVFIAANCYSAVSIVDYPERWTTSKSDETRESVRSGARAALHRSWEIFADSIGAAGALSAEEPGALAFLTVVVSRWSGARKHLKEARPAFVEALERLESHPAIAPVLREHRAA
ncbi:MAG: glutathione S-transferase family protein, partial [Polyangiaceae bacterium]